MHVIWSVVQGIWDLDQSDDRDEDDSVLILGGLFEAQQDWTTAGSLFDIRDFPWKQCLPSKQVLTFLFLSLQKLLVGTGSNKTAVRVTLHQLIDVFLCILKSISSGVFDVLCGFVVAL